MAYMENITNIYYMYGDCNYKYVYIYEAGRERERERKTRKGNKRHTDWEGRNKTIFVCT